MFIYLFTTIFNFGDKGRELGQTLHCMTHDELFPRNLTVVLVRERESKREIECVCVCMCVCVYVCVCMCVYVINSPAGTLNATMAELTYSLKKLISAQSLAARTNY